jgi:hypothetical protein
MNRMMTVKPLSRVQMPSVDTSIISHSVLPKRFLRLGRPCQQDKSSFPSFILLPCIRFLDNQETKFKHVKKWGDN